MYKKRYTRLILFAIMALIVLIAASVFFVQQTQEIKNYNKMKDSPSVDTTLVMQENMVFEEGGIYKWRFTFVVDGRMYVGSTINYYKFYKEGDIIKIKYLTDKEGKVAILYEKDEIGNDKPIMVRINKVNHFLAQDAKEEVYFDKNPKPTVTFSVFVFIIGALLLLAAAYHLYYILLYKSIEKNGFITYGVYDDSTMSRFGSMKSLSVKFRYKTVDDEWREAKTPYCYTKFDIEKLKDADTFRVKYKNKTAIISENLRNL